MAGWSRVRLWISGEECRYEAGSIAIETSIGQRSTASCRILHTSDRHFEEGEPVLIEDGQAGRVFVGFIASVTEHSWPGNNTDLMTEIACVDNHYLADKRLAARSYVDTAAGDIIRDLVEQYLAVEGITILEHDVAFLQPTMTTELGSGETVDDGPVLRQVVFNYAPVSDCISAVAERIGWIWWIDEFRVLHFGPRERYQAPFSVDANKIIAGTLRVHRASPRYRNRQYIRGGQDVTDPQVETFAGDGQRRTFTVGFSIAEAPVVKLNGVEQTVEVKGIGNPAQWYWSKGDPVIVQDASGTVLTASDTLEITYRGLYRIITMSEDQEAQYEQDILEGVGSGIVEAVQQEVSITSRSAAFQLAADLLQQYTQRGTKISFETWEAGLRPGQLLTANFPVHGLVNEQVLIESVSVSEVGPGGHLSTRYVIQAILGPAGETWVEWFRRLASQREDLTSVLSVGESDVLVILVRFAKTWQQADMPKLFQRLLPGAGLYPGASTYCSFERDKRIVYLAWGDGSGPVDGRLGHELGRKQITNQTQDDDLEVFSLTYIAPYEANGQITELGWFGGDAASEAAGSGVLVAYESYSHMKTDAESLQIERTDTRGW